MSPGRPLRACTRARWGRAAGHPGSGTVWRRLIDSEPREEFGAILGVGSGGGRFLAASYPRDGADWAGWLAGSLCDSGDD